jgi:hypothetical protein
VFKQIARTLRDPFYRMELRQIGAAREVGAVVTIIVCFVLPFVVLPPLSLFALTMIQALLTAGAFSREWRAGTLEGILLTPMERGRIIWSKFAGTLRPCALAAVIVAGTILTLTGTLVLLGAASDPAILTSLVQVLGWSLGAGIVIMAQGLLGAAVGTVAALESRGRATIYGRVALLAFVFVLAELFTLMLTGLTVSLLASILIQAGGPGTLVTSGWPLMVPIVAACVCVQFLLFGVVVPRRMLSGWEREFDARILGPDGLGVSG